MVKVYDVKCVKPCYTLKIENSQQLARVHNVYYTCMPPGALSIIHMGMHTMHCNGENNILLSNQYIELIWQGIFF